LTFLLNLIGLFIYKVTDFKLFLPGVKMMQKRVLLAILMIHCFFHNMLAGQSADGVAMEKKKDQKAYVLGVESWSDNKIVKDCKQKNIPFTDSINGESLSSWLSDFFRSDTIRTDNVFVAQQSLDSGFSVKTLDAYDIDTLRKYRNPSKRTQAFLSGDIDEEHMLLVKNLLKGKCTLCIYENQSGDKKNVLVFNPEKKHPEEMCRQFEPFLNVKAEESKNKRAQVIDWPWSGRDSQYRKYDIPITHKINGVNIFHWLSDDNARSKMKIDNISVVSLSNGKFDTVVPMKTYDIDALRQLRKMMRVSTISDNNKDSLHAYFEHLPFRYNSKEYRLVKSFGENKCCLCTFPNEDRTESVIVIDEKSELYKENPKEICSKLERVLEERKLKKSNA